MLEAIANYWLTFLLSLISGALVFLCKKFYKLWQKERDEKEQTAHSEFFKKIESLITEASNESRQEERRLQEQINIIKDGVLSLQGRNFKQECRHYLQPAVEFSIEEFEGLQQDHQIYNDLGGNHMGDELFKLVIKKATEILTDDK